MTRLISLLVLLARTTLTISSPATPTNSGHGETKFYAYTSEWSFAGGWYRREIADGWITTVKKPPYQSRAIRGSMGSSQDIYDECCQRYERGNTPPMDRRRTKPLPSPDDRIWRKPKARAYEKMCFNDALQATGVEVPDRRNAPGRRVPLIEENNDNDNDQQADVVKYEAETRKTWRDTSSKNHDSTSPIDLIPNTLKGADWGNVAVQAGAAMRDVGHNINWAEMMPKRVMISP